MTGWHGLTDDSPPPWETLPWVFCSRAGSLQHCTGILGGSLSAPHHGIQLQGCYHPTWAPAKIDLRSLRLLRRRSALKVLYFHLPAVDQIQKLYETSAFLIVGSECGVFSLLVRKKSSTLSQPCIYFYSGLWAWGKPRVLSRLLELIHPMFLRIHFVKYSFTLKIYCWEKGNVTGLTWHRLAKKNPNQPSSSAWNFSVSMVESAPGAAWAFSKREMHSSEPIIERQHVCIFSLQPLLGVLKNRVLFLASLRLIHQLYGH